MFGISNPLVPSSPPRTDAHRLISSMDAKNRREQKDRVLRVPRETQKRREQRGLCEGAKNDGYVWRALPGRGGAASPTLQGHTGNFQMLNMTDAQSGFWFFQATFFQPGSYLVLHQTSSACSGIFQGHEAPEAPEKGRSQRSGQPAQVWLKLA